MTTTRDTKDYLSKKEIPQLFECLMTGLLYHRPKDHLGYLQHCLDNIREHGVNKVKWDLFVDAKSPRQKLEPLSRENSALSQASSHTSSFSKKEKLPAIGHHKHEEHHHEEHTHHEHHHEDHAAPRHAPKKHLELHFKQHVDVVLAIGGPGSDMEFFCRGVVNRHKDWVHLPMRRLLKQWIQEHHASEENAQMEKGRMVATEIVMECLVDHMNRHGHEKCFILDGFPKSADQYSEFLQLLSGKGEVKFAFLVDYDEEQLRRAVRGKGRVDSATIERRVKQYQNDVLPLCKDLDDIGRLNVLLGEKSKEEILEDVLDVFREHFPSKREHSHAGDSDEEEEDKKFDEQEVLEIPLPNVEVLDEGRKTDYLPDSVLVLVMGGPSSGRTQHIKRLCESREDGDFVHIDAKQFGEEAKVDVEDIVEAIQQSGNPKAIFLEGFPSTEAQLNDLNARIGGVDAVLLLDCYENTLAGRAEKSRDSRSAVHRRISHFKEQTLSLVRHFDEAGKLHVILGDRDEEIVHSELVELVSDNWQQWENRRRQPVQEEEIEDTTAFTTGKDGRPRSADARLKDAKVLFVLGGPGSGKGTQCAKLVEKYGFNHVATGDLLRAEVESGSERGQQLQQIMERGELVSLDIVLDLLRDAMIERVAQNPCFLVDGFPRELEQGIRFEDEVCECHGVLMFDVSEEVMRQRLLKRGETSGRVDDNEETIIKRLRTFNECTKPVIDHFQDKGKLNVFDASGQIDDIFEAVCEKIDSLGMMSEPSHTEKPKSAHRDVEKLRDAKVLFVLGGPGSGKGTQCAKLVEKYGFNHVATGDLLRAEVESGSERGQQLQQIMERGELVSLDIVLDLLRDAMIERVAQNPCFLVDGFPRELEQGIRFEDEVCECHGVLMFDVSEEVMRQRLLKRGETSGRVDDNEETIIKRLRTFNECTKPVIDHFQDKGKLTVFDASGQIDDIFNAVCDVVDKLNIVERETVDLDGLFGDDDDVVEVEEQPPADDVVEIEEQPPAETGAYEGDEEVLTVEEHHPVEEEEETAGEAEGVAEGVAEGDVEEQQVDAEEVHESDVGEKEEEEVEQAED